MSDTVNSLFTWVDSAGFEHVLDVDVVMSANDKRSAKLSDHVVETGAVITDHVIIQPESLSLDLVVTQTPLGGPEMAPAPISINAPSRAMPDETVPIKVAPNNFVPGGYLLLSQGLRSVISSGLGLIGLGGAGTPTSIQGRRAVNTSRTLTANVLQARTPSDRVVDVHDQLIEILTDSLLVTVSFKGRLYPEYLLTEVELVHASGKFGEGQFKVTARAFRTVDAETAVLPDPADFRALAASNKGSKNAKNPDPVAPGKLKSHAAGLADGDLKKAASDAYDHLTGN